MIEALRKINLKSAIFMGLLFYSLTLVIHVLIIVDIIPFTWVNGGRSESISSQLPISIINIVISIIGGFFTLIAGGIIPYKYKRVVTAICWFYVVLWSVGFIQQLLGTSFERMICSFILLLGVISNLRLAIEQRRAN